jgi:hypothetical protein
MANEEIYRIALEYRACRVNDEIVRLEEDIRLAYVRIKRLQKWADEGYVNPQPRGLLEDAS